MTLGQFSLRHGTALVASLFTLAIAGIFAARSLPSGVYPEVEFPRIVVVARGGDDPADVFETQVTRPLEQSLVTVLGVRRVKSKTIRGAAEVSLEFVAGTDMWRSLQFVQSQLSNVRGAFPQAMNFEVERLTPTSFPVVTFNLSGPMSPSDLRELAEFVVRPVMARVPGVGQVRVLGGDVREFEVVVDPARATALRLRPADIATRIRDAVTFGAVGRLDEDRQLLPVLVSGEVHSTEELANVPVSVTSTGVTLPLSSVATVTEGAVDRTSAVGGPNGETVLISVSRAEGASTPDVVRGVQAAALEAAGAFPRGVALEPVYDQANLVEESAASVRDAILLGVVLCLIVLGISLKDVRAGFVAAAAVPLVLAGTFVLMKVFHQTLNLMSLGGLAVAIGLVIDDAIIVVEAIIHRLERGEEPQQAAAGGTTDLAAAVFGTTITTVIVFLPLASVAGLVGDFFSALAVTLTSAVLLSLLVALTVVPVFAARFLRRREQRSTTRPALERFYGRVANFGAAHRWVGVACLGFAVLGSLAISRVVETGFLPAMDEGAFVVDYFLPAGTSLHQTVETARKIERILAQTPEVRSFSRRTGAELGPAAATLVNSGDIMVSLKADRGRSSEQIIEALRERLTAEVPAARFEFLQVLQDVLNDLSGAPRPVELKFFGSDRAVLEALAREAHDRLEKIDGIADLYDGVEPQTPTLLFRVKREAASRLGRTTRDVMDETRSVLAGINAGTVRRLDRLIDIRVRYADSVRFDPAQVPRLPLTFASTGGDSTSPGTTGVVPLSALVAQERVPVPAELRREGLQPVIVVTAAIEHRDLGSVMAEVKKALAGLKVPPGNRLEVGGLDAAQQETFTQLALVAFFGGLLVMLVLIAQFRRVRPALAVLLTVPFALFGALVTLWATGTPLNASSLMGCVLLVGLEVKSGILLLEVAEAHSDEGLPYLAALRLAAERRIRPIMLTTTATMFGVLPLALGIGAGAELQQPLAIAVLGGIVVSKFMTLAALPSLAALFATPAAHRGAAP